MISPTDEQLQDQLREVKKRLRLSMNGVVSQSMRDKGLNYRIIFGVELPRIKYVASFFYPEHKLAQALWKEDIRECKIMATLLQPQESFYPEIAEIWVEDIKYLEIAENLVMHLLQYMDYAPQLAFQWLAREEEFFQVCAYLLITRLLSKKGDMEDQVAGEFLDQAISAAFDERYNVRHVAIGAIKRFMQHSEDHAFRVCRLIEQYKEMDTDYSHQLIRQVEWEAAAYE